jgi:hypothetical protein
MFPTGGVGWFSLKQLTHSSQPHEHHLQEDHLILSIDMITEMIKKTSLAAHFPAFR